MTPVFPQGAGQPLGPTMHGNDGCKQRAGLTEVSEHNCQGTGDPLGVWLDPLRNAVALQALGQQPAPLLGPGAADSDYAAASPRQTWS